MCGLKTTFLLLALLPFVSVGQRSDDYLLADCDDSLIVASLFWDDTVMSRQISSPFVLKDHLSWLGPPVLVQQHTWYQDSQQLICLTNEQRDSIIHHPSMYYILYTTGYSQPGPEVSETDKKYSVRIESIGCLSSYDTLIAYHNRMMEKILLERNGTDWKSRYTNEVKTNTVPPRKKR